MAREKVAAAEVAANAKVEAAEEKAAASVRVAPYMVNSLGVASKYAYSVTYSGLK